MTDTDVLLDQTFRHMIGVYLAQRIAQSDYWEPRVLITRQQAEAQIARNLQALATVDDVLAELSWADDRTH